jgi:uncharacterized membrane protein
MASFEPLLGARAPIPVHAIVALSAVLFGAVQMLLRKGTKLHRVLGYLWVSLLALVALSGFFIHKIRMFGLFSPIQLLSVLAWILWLAVCRPHGPATCRVTVISWCHFFIWRCS